MQRVKATCPVLGVNRRAGGVSDSGSERSIRVSSQVSGVSDSARQSAGTQGMRNYDTPGDRANRDSKSSTYCQCFCVA